MELLSLETIALGLFLIPIIRYIIIQWDKNHPCILGWYVKILFSTIMFGISAHLITRGIAELTR